MMLDTYRLNIVTYQLHPLKPNKIAHSMWIYVHILIDQKHHFGMRWTQAALCRQFWHLADDYIGRELNEKGLLAWMLKRMSYVFLCPAETSRFYVICEITLHYCKVMRLHNCSFSLQDYFSSVAIGKFPRNFYYTYIIDVQIITWFFPAFFLF